MLTIAARPPLARMVLAAPSLAPDPSLPWFVADGVTCLEAVPAARTGPLSYVVFRVPAGFPSPSDDYVEEALDLGKLLVQNPAAMRFGPQYWGGCGLPLHLFGE